MNSDSYRDDAADARRYRHLRSKPSQCPDSGLDVAIWSDCRGEPCRGEELDAVVDAEIAADLPRGGLTPEEDDEAQAMNDSRPD